jgi:aspartyl-tRNA(Asn)/glutamyl-tRNA(Gln) amidotransferase subunit C
MPLSLAEFQHLCRLASLEPDPSGQERMAAECAEILAYMDKLAELDTTDIEPLYSPTVLFENAFPPAGREDIATRRRKRGEILSGAPESDGVFFTVPLIVEGKA